MTLRERVANWLAPQRQHPPIPMHPPLSGFGSFFGMYRSDHKTFVSDLVQEQLCGLDIDEITNDVDVDGVAHGGVGEVLAADVHRTAGLTRIGAADRIGVRRAAVPGSAHRSDAGGVQDRCWPVLGRP